MSKPTVIAICAIGKSGQMGLAGGLPWHDPADLTRFKQITRGHILICGYNTAKTLPVLPGRLVYVPPRDEAPGTTLVIMAHHNESKIYLIGGPKLFTQWVAAGLIDRWDITRIDYDGKADAWFNPEWLCGVNSKQAEPPKDANEAFKRMYQNKAYHR